MKKIAFLLLLASSLQMTAQDTGPSFWKNLKYGGGLGLSFGSNNTAIAISPSVIYPVSHRVYAGINTSYLYAKQYDLKSNVYGVGVVTLYNPFEQLQVSAEFGQLFISQRLGLEKSKYNYPVLNLGVAYRIGFFSTGIQVDVLYQENKSIYASPISPIVRFYF